MDLRAKFNRTMGYDNYDDDVYEDEVVDIEGAKRRKKKRSTKKKGGCCGAGMSGGASYQQMIKAIAAHNRRPGTKKIKAGVGSTKAAVTKAYNKIKGRRGGAPITRNKDMDEAYKLILSTQPFISVDGQVIVDDIKSWPIPYQEGFINAALDGKIKTITQLRKYFNENQPLDMRLEEPYELDVYNEVLPCNYNEESMAMCRKIKKLQLEFRRKYGVMPENAVF